MTGDSSGAGLDLDAGSDSPFPQFSLEDKIKFFIYKGKS